ncbi:MAG TPA: ParB/RepB/Spo0J family partition protein [Gammaproteobacteria bacterium]|nr:ParB/RepB/Spo0J family partition protein [Gammaproteobacteria bacterium]
MAKKRGLGRGLDALLGATQAASPETAASDAPAAAGAAPATRLPVDRIQRGRYQPRRHFDEDRLRELADSIAAQGMVQPIVVRPVGDAYEIIAGERRWRAAQLAGLAEVPVVIHEVDDQTAMAMALIENIQRDDLNPLEEAAALHRLLDEFGLTHQQVAQSVGKSRTTVTNLLRLLELDAAVKAMLEAGELEMGHARALLGLKNGALQLQAAREVVKKGLSVRETEALVRKLSQPPKPKPAPPEEDPDIRRLLDDLTDRLGARVTLRQGTGGKGRLEIAYNSLDELEGILAHIK